MRVASDLGQDIDRLASNYYGQHAISRDALRRFGETLLRLASAPEGDTT